MLWTFVRDYRFCLVVSQLRQLPRACYKPTEMSLNIHGSGHPYSLPPFSVQGSNWTNSTYNYGMTWNRFPHYWPFMRGIAKANWCGDLMFSFFCSLTNWWAISIFILIIYTHFSVSNCLTYWDRDKMGVILQTIFSKYFSWIFLVPKE